MTGVFRTLRVEAGQIEALPLHLQKLKEECDLLKLTPELPSPHEIALYLQAEGALTGTHRLKILCEPKHVFLSLQPYADDPGPVTLMTYPHPIDRTDYHIKSLNYTHRTNLLHHAQSAGYTDCLTFNSSRFVLETSIANLLWRHNNTLYYTDHTLPYYPGLTQSLLLTSASSLGLSLQPAQITPNELRAYPLYMCNSLKRLVPVHSLDGHVLPQDPAFHSALLAALKTRLVSPKVITTCPCRKP